MLFSELTTIRVGGPAFPVEAPASREELAELALGLWSRGEPWLALGGGSNLLVGDEGFDGTVIRLVTRGIEQELVGDRVRLRVAAGESWDGLVALTVANGWSGIEALSGIPGSVGAAPIQNIGAYGQELSDTLVAIEFLDYERGELLRLSAAELELGYRSSVIKRGRTGIVVSVELDLAASGDGRVAFPQLASALGVPLGTAVPLAEVRSTVLALRAAKGMVLDPADPDSVSCGSFFTNPIVSESFARGLPQDAPRWPIAADLPDIAVPLGQEPALPAPTSPALVKLSAAWLIERAGVSKGFALPGSRAAVSRKHSLALTNRGGATAAEVAQLARYIRALVSARFGVELQPEPVAVGVEL